MKKSLQLTGIASILVVGAVFGIFVSNVDTNEEVTGHASLAKVDLADHISNREYAIVGTVKEVGASYHAQSEYAPRYFSDVLITVEEDLLGTISDREIVIRTHANIAEEVTFNVGERAILFLVKSTAENAEGEGVYVVSGMHQGKFEIIDGIVKDPKYSELTYNETDLRQQIKSQRG